MNVVGASILNVITESLYDKPIVVFREYVQNAVDSFLRDSKIKDKCVEIWFEDNDLLFLDNGLGIDSDKEFQDSMKSIGRSSKRKYKDIGYKGIGRLSGISYCDQLVFVDILDYKKEECLYYSVDCKKYRKIKNTDEYYQLSFEELMDKIGSTIVGADIKKKIFNELNSKSYLFDNTNRGFLVLLNNTNDVLGHDLRKTLDNSLITELGWLLPVPFNSELYEDDNLGAIFQDLSGTNGLNDNALVKSYKIRFNGQELYRPIDGSMFREYTSYTDFENYAKCIVTFSQESISIQRQHDFNGIKIYYDNMLLCDETELISVLESYNMLSHTTNEMLQSVRGVGVLLYITNKICISTNARRTFFEVVDEDSLDLLKLISEFVERVYNARYSLSKYRSAVKKSETNQAKIEELRDAAEKALNGLTQERLELQAEVQETFNELSLDEQKRVIRQHINQLINAEIKGFLKSVNEIYPRFEDAYDSFLSWLTRNR